MGGLDSPRLGFGLLAALYVLSFPYHPGLRSPNELCRLWQSRALVEDGTVHINGPLSRLGMVGDLSCTAMVAGGELRPCVGPDAPTSGVMARSYYPSKAPLLSFLGAPVYWLTRAVVGEVSELTQVLVSRLVLTVLPALGLLVLLRRFLATYVPRDTADTLVVVYGLGTLAFSYAEAFLSHQVTAALVFACFYVAWRVERHERPDTSYLLAGALGGAAVVAEYTAALFVVCVSALVVASRWKQWGALVRAAGLVVVGAVPPLVFLLWYHHHAFGDPLVSGYRFLNDAAYMGWHQGGFLGIKLPSASALVLSFFSPLRGLFTLSPFLVTALWGLADVRHKERPYAVMLVVMLVASAYFTSSFSYQSWGWTPGPRHLTPLIPFLVLPVALLLERLEHHSRVAHAVVAGLCLSSVVVMGLVVFVNYIPDDVSTSLWGLVLPLLLDGLPPVSWLSAAVPSEVGGAVLYLALLGAVAWVFTRFRRAGAAPVVLAAVVALHVGSLKLATRGGPQDRAAQALLKQVWVARPGSRIPF